MREGRGGGKDEEEGTTRRAKKCNDRKGPKVGGAGRVMEIPQKKLGGLHKQLEEPQRELKRPRSQLGGPWGLLWNLRGS